MNTILITAYAVSPYKGSEDGTAWNMIFQLAKQHRIIAITRENNQADIDRFFEENKTTLAPEHLANFQFAYYDLPRYARFWKKGARGALPYFYLWQMSLPRFIKKNQLHKNVDIVHNLNFHSDWTPSFLWQLKKPFVWGPIGHHPKVPRNYILPQYGWSAYLKDRFRWVMKQAFWLLDPFLKVCKHKADHILAINSSVQKHLSVSEQKISIVPAVGAEKTPPTPTRTTHTSASPKFTVLSIGRFVPLKAFEGSISAFAHFFHQLSAENQKKVELVLVGKGPLKQRLQQQAKDLGLGEDVFKIIQWIPRHELTTIYQNASVFLFPSHEGAGMVVPEALSYGLPVVCFDNYGPGEFINETCGIKVAYGDYQQSIEQLGNAAKRLFDEPVFRQQLSAGAKAQYQQVFDWEVKTQQIGKIYADVLEAQASFVVASRPSSGHTQTIS